MKRVILLVIAILFLSAGIVIGTRWSEYDNMTSGTIADADTFMVQDSDDDTLGAAGTLKEYPYSVLKADLTTWMNGTNFTSITGDRVTTGYIEGGVRFVETTADENVTVTGSNALFINNHASTITYTLPDDPETAGGDSKLFCFRNRKANAITITPGAGDVIELKKTDGSAAQSIVSDGAVGEQICVMGFDDAGTDRWLAGGLDSNDSWDFVP